MMCTGVMLAWYLCARYEFLAVSPLYLQQRLCTHTHYGPLLLAWCTNVLHVQSVLLSHTVLSELYQKKLVTKDELKGMKGEILNLSVQVVLVQCTKPPEVVARTAAVLDKYELDVDTRQLRGW